MTATEFIRLKKADCTNCYKCIRHCPVKAIRFSGGQAHIIPEECIQCGKCFVICPQDAKNIFSELSQVRMYLSSGEDVCVSLAPSFVANYNTGIESMKKALLKLGFKDVQETAIGATIVKREYDRLINEEHKDVLISSCCHSINLLIQKYYPNELCYLASVLSPMLAHCKKIREEHPGCRTVFIGPCISKKDEAERYGGIVDAVLTFDELSAWLKEENIVVEQDKDDYEHSKARLFPTTGGIIRSMLADHPDYSYISVDGVENCMEFLENIERGNVHKCFIEMSACVGSCIGGPLMEQKENRMLDNRLAVDRYAGKKDFDVSQPEPSHIAQKFEYVPLYEQQPTEAEIQAILNRMGKHTKADELNCGGCGYDTCRKKAIAVYQEKAEITMCFPYLRAQSAALTDNITDNSPNGIFVLNERLEVQKINPMARHMLSIRRDSDVLGENVTRILDPDMFVRVLETGKNIKDEIMYLADYRLYVETTITYDKETRSLICIMRDITDEQIEREKRVDVIRQTAEVADSVVEKQMRIVQEIASLLGETAAETKIALTKLKESISDE